MHLVHLEDVTPESQDARHGWLISEFRLPITGADGSSSALFHGRFRPGSVHKRHRHTKATELCVYLAGDGLVGAGEDRYAMPPMAYRAIPAGVDHYFANDTREGLAEVVGLYAGAPDMPSGGYEFTGEVTEADRAASRTGSLDSATYPAGRVPSGPGVHRLLAVTEPTPACVLYGSWDAPGPARLAVAPAAELILFVARGGGVLHANAGGTGGGVTLRAGHALLLRPGESCAIEGTTDGSGLDLVGFVTGSTSVDAAGLREEAG